MAEVTDDLRDTRLPDDVRSRLDPLLDSMTPALRLAFLSALDERETSTRALLLTLRVSLLQE